LIATAKHEFATESGVRLDYFEIVDPDTLDAESHITKRALVAVAAFVGKTRLIDNILLEP
jgi:pantothenate synthetase